MYGKTLLQYLLKIKRSRFTTIIVVAIHMQDLFAFNRKDTRENAFGQTSAKNNDIVLLILTCWIVGVSEMEMSLSGNETMFTYHSVNKVFVKRRKKAKGP